MASTDQSNRPACSCSRRPPDVGDHIALGRGDEPEGDPQSWSRTSRSRASRPSTCATTRASGSSTPRASSSPAPICDPAQLPEERATTSSRSATSTKWLGERTEAARRRDLPGLRRRQAADRGQSRGRRAHRRHGRRQGRASPSPPSQPGMDIFAKVTVLGEGVRGTLTKQLIERFDLDGASTRRPMRRASRRSGASIRRSTGPGRVVHGIALPRDPERLPRHVALRHEGQPHLVRLRDAARDHRDPH